MRSRFLAAGLADDQGLELDCRTSLATPSGIGARPASEYPGMDRLSPGMCIETFPCTAGGIGT